ncbi:HNH endonuclease [Massilia pseudoviolaceinigra]|uniref:HNH endonuclease n=1 Tax=Massilia pseudoviolaceinigra TaxID=3057165 RepID=UPI00279650D7|nr:HNH endonuclease [Massilia sp. CCM 9206]MDQ1919254.1 HNH endonuclease [Massilia sp. CCM 9206]
MPDKIKAVKAARARAFRIQAGHCCYCGWPMWLDNPSAFAARYNLSRREAAWFQRTAEHCIAKCEGGTNRAENIRAACRFCNQRRHRRATVPDAKAYACLVRNRMLKGGWHSPALFKRMPVPYFSW